MQNFLEKNKINYWYSQTDRKCAVVERFQRSLQDILYKIMSEKNSYKWVSFLDQALKIYHNREHASLGGLTPMQAEKEENHDEIRKINYKRYREADMHAKKPKFAVDDVVRIAVKRGKFMRSYFSNFTEEFFYINEVLTKHPQPRYKLRDYNGTILTDIFYENELSAFKPSKDFNFKIEKVLRTKGKGKNKKVLIKWLGWPEIFNSWIPEADVKKI